jgi:hypothetical protein
MTANRKESQYMTRGEIRAYVLDAEVKGDLITADITEGYDYHHTFLFYTLQ